MSGPQPVLPDYGGRGLTGVVPALMAEPGQRPAWLPEAVREAEQVVLLVVDGLGWLQWQDRLHLTPRLASLEGDRITSVAPSTTAAALTSLVVGAPPAAHGIVGYRVVVDGPSGPDVMNVLRWRTGAGDARPFVDPHRFQVLDPFGGRPVPVVSKADFAGTGFTESHQRGAVQVGWFQASSMAVDIGALLGAEERFVYAYYDGVDRIAHIRGFGPHYDAELVALDRLVGDLIDGLPAGAALAVTADHGQVLVGDRAVPMARRLMDEVSMTSGEARFRWLHAKDGTPGAADKLAAAARDLYGDQAWVATYDQVEAEGWLGGRMPPEFRARVGDVALVPFEPVGYLESVEAGDFQLACRHGSLTPEEMWVPLVGGRGRLDG